MQIVDNVELKHIYYCPAIEPSALSHCLTKQAKYEPQCRPKPVGVAVESSQGLCRDLNRLLMNHTDDEDVDRLGRMPLLN